MASDAELALSHIHQGKCPLCPPNSPPKLLSKSHIIPRAYFAELKKRGGGQLVVYRSESKEGIKNESIKEENSDPKDRLLCAICESFLNDTYEQYGTHLLKDTNNVKRTKNAVVVNNFKYKTFYLYLISILWRASVSKKKYPHIELGEDINNIIRHYIKNNTLKRIPDFGLRLDHFIRVSMIRIDDKSGQLSPADLKKILIDLTRDGKNEDSVCYYMMLQGFLIIFTLSVEENLHAFFIKREFAQLKNRQRIEIPIRDITMFKPLVDCLNDVRTKSKNLRSK